MKRIIKSRQTDRPLSDEFPIQNDLDQDAIDFALEYALYTSGSR
jgi:hypothetical protein